MSIITPDMAHSRNWIKCPMCDGGKTFTVKDRMQGAMCGSCDNTGEVPRHVYHKANDSSSFYECQAGA